MSGKSPFRLRRPTLYPIDLRHFILASYFKKSTFVWGLGQDVVDDVCGFDTGEALVQAAMFECELVVINP